MRARAAATTLITTLVVTIGLPTCGGAQSLRGTVELVHIADVDTPTAFAVRFGDDALYVAEQDGRVVAVDDSGDVSTVLDLTDRTSADDEQGLLGLVFSPGGERLYVHFTNNAGDTRVEEYAVDDEGPVVSSRRRILAVRQPQANHNGGQLAFGPDGMLYLGLGDGGGSGDEDSGHAREGNAQSLRTLLGKILRIDPTPNGDSPYTIPDDNPFADGGGRPEIWSYGLRNPWRFSFDRAGGDLWIGDVGQDEWEEINVSPAAQGAGDGWNFGWNVFEAEERYRDGDTNGPALPPLLSLSRDDGNCSVIGGFVYRGTTIPDLVGAYVYADYCNGRLRYVRESNTEVEEKGSLGVSLDEVSSFGEDNDGELYVLSQSSGLYRIDPA
ncbi:MAG: PQQ-dependent sugar dehydrogenase [Acidimicrobiia bacterium]